MVRPFQLITFSHLRWEFVFQRPQHLLSRLAAKHRVIFVEEPIFDASCEPHWERRPSPDNVTVLRPHTPVEEPGFCDQQMPFLEALVSQLVEKEKLTNYVAWFYTPLALPLVESLVPLAVVYDCMDELSAFLNAPKQLIDREAELLKLADLVFTGGPSLYRAKKNRHPNAHCFSSSVDAKYFARARSLDQGAIAEAADQAHIPHPRIGFFGVIDERIDLGVLDYMARIHPEWQIVMLGPVVKIDPATLPKRPNLHYLGQKSYADLPSYVAGWDVCMLPFARNESTKFISPTKTLEYMAAEKPIVSTPIRDVAEPYGHIVHMGETPASFVASCERALNASVSEKMSRVELMREVLSRTSWDATAKAMEYLIDQTIQQSLHLDDGVFVPAAAAKPATAATATAIPAKKKVQKSVPGSLLAAGNGAQGD